MENYDEDDDRDVGNDEDEVHTLTYSCIMAPNRCTKRFLTISDSIIAFVIVTPLVVGHWYGTWGFMDQFIEYFPTIPTLLFGLFYHLMMVVTRHHVHERVKVPHHREKTFIEKAARYLFKKLYIYVFSVACIMVFRAIFVLCAPYGKQRFLLKSTFFICSWYLFNRNCKSQIQVHNGYSMEHHQSKNNLFPGNCVK